MTDTASISIKQGARRTDILFALLFAASVAYAIWLAPFGYVSADEGFYLTVPYRLAQGDALFVDEWNGSQLSGFLLYPLMKLYLWLSPNREGMLLCFRYIYIAVAGLTAIYLYYRGRRVSPMGALAGSLIMFLYSPLCIKALSYHSMFVLLSACACVTAATIEKRGWADMFFAGLCIAGDVLCCPYLIVVAPVYILIVALYLWRRRRRGETGSVYYALSARGALAFCAGAFALFVVFCVFVFSRSSLGQLIESIPYALTDPEHVDLGWLWYVKNYILCIIKVSRPALKIVILFFLLCAVLLLDKNRLKRRVLYALGALALSLWFFIPFTAQLGANETMFAINFLGVAAYCLCEKKQRSIFNFVFIPGLLFSPAMHHASNQRFHAICNAASICAIASAFFIVELASELLAEAKKPAGTKPGRALNTAAALLIAAALPAQIGAQVYVKATRVYDEQNLPHMDTLMDRGLEKGLMTTAEKAADYRAVWDDTQRVRDAEGEYVLYVSANTWLPLADSKRTAANTGWTFYDKPELSLPVLVEYMKLHPEKYPVNIYVTEELTYSYQPSYDGQLIVDILNFDKRPVEKIATGYLIK